MMLMKIMLSGFCNEYCNHFRTKCSHNGEEGSISYYHFIAKANYALLFSLKAVLMLLTLKTTNLAPPPPLVGRRKTSRYEKTADKNSSRRLDKLKKQAGR